MRGRPVATLAALLIIGSTGLLTLNSIMSVRQQIAVSEFCDAVHAGRSDVAARQREELFTPDADGLIAAECRCDALSSSGQPGECARFFCGQPLELHGSSRGAQSGAQLRGTGRRRSPKPSTLIQKATRLRLERAVPRQLQRLVRQREFTK